MKKAKYSIEQYDADILLIVSDNYIEDRNKLNEIYDMHVPPLEKEIMGEVMDDGCGRYIILFAVECMTHLLISHEAFHLTESIVKRHNAFFGGEHVALLHCRIVDFLYRHIEKWKIKIIEIPVGYDPWQTN